MSPVRGPAYLSDLLTRLPDDLGMSELFLHLGHYVSGTEDIRVAQEQMNSILLERLALTESLDVLDVGCGIGGTLAVIDASYEGMNLFGLNVGMDQLQVAARSVEPRGGNRLSWVQGDANAMPFPDDCLDRVIALEAIFHFPSRERFIREAARVLRPGGRLVLSDLRIAENADPALLAFITSGLAPWPDPFAREGGLSELAGRAGFVCEEEDVSDLVGPSFESMMGAAAIADPQRVANPGDRGTSALGRLYAERALSIVYLQASLQASLDASARS